MIHSPFEESILWTCLENQELLKKALTILSLDCCSTDAGLEVQHYQPPANSACFRLASTILTGNSHVLSIILLLLFWIQWYLCTDRLLGLSYVWSQGEILSATKDLSVHSWMEFPPSTWLIPEFVLSNPCGGCFIPKLCPTFATPWTVSPSGSSVHGISKARILEWVPIPSPGDLPDPEIESQSLVCSRQILYHWATREVYIYLSFYIYKYIYRYL